VLQRACQSVLVIAATLICIGRALAFPATTPTDAIVEIQLEDPVSPQTKPYLDLDTGKTFRRDESPGADFLLSHQWLRENGIDVMSETRSPVEGFVAYRLALIPVAEAFDSPRKFSSVRDAVQAVEAQPFDLFSIADSRPKTYLFRTAENALGVLEVKRVADFSGLRLRYKHLHAPPPPPGRPRELKDLANQIEQQRALIAQLNPKFRDNRIAAQRRLKMLQDQLVVESTERDPKIASLKRMAIAEQFVIDSAVSPGDPETQNLKSHLESLQNRIAVMDVTRDDWQVREEALARLGDEEANRRLQQLGARFGPEHPEAIRARAEVALRQELLQIQRSETDPEMSHLKQEKLRTEYLIKLANEPRPLPFLKLADLEVQHQRLTRLISERERKLATTATAPTTSPAPPQ
jgi:hypothetical protein